MASVNLRATAVCPGGDHVTIRATLDGGGQQDVVLAVGQIIAPLTAEEAAAVSLMLLRLYARGKTGAQIKTGLQGAGVTVVTG